MTVNISGKSWAGVAASAGALVVAAVVATAPTSAAPPCAETKYPSKASSTTTLRVATVAHYGEATDAHVRVASTGTTPRGTVSLTIDGAFLADAELDSLGRSTFRMPSSLAAGKTHRVTVSYPGDCDVNGSEDTKHQTIMVGAKPGKAPAAKPGGAAGQIPRSPIRIDAGV